ncbi:polyamine ABC transporter substrate-binding protein [Dongia soli]|uniref:Putrescine-binding periplasmic protein n=1 Tax=Dongia soli TaxID=600628 RepID=A0ABU5EE84_9PROT|nr:polyamine ABC transporter substrate-binding protein [Dongia soli]MDY0884641.1 polyamine ABC transporter substrate-binding protein [Dongia soli]
MQRQMKRIGMAGLALVGLGVLASEAWAEDKEVNVYNWADYIGAHTIEKFEQATGIKVRYDLFDSNEVVEAKMLAGGSGYDVITITSSYLGRQLKGGVFQKLDKSKLPNWKNLDPVALKSMRDADPNNEYGVPYFWGTTGIAYNVKKIKERMPDAPIDSWAMLFDPAVASKFADCGIGLLDTPTVLPLTLAYMGKNPDTKSEADYDEVGQVMAKVRPYFRKIDNAGYKDALATGELCLVMAWNGDVASAVNTAKEAKTGVEIAYTLPKEGTYYWIDALAVPKDAPHPEAAMKYINFLMNAQIAADGINTVTYASGVGAAKALADPAITNDPIIYPTAEDEKKLFGGEIEDLKLERLRTRIWTKFVAGN